MTINIEELRDRARISSVLALDYKMVTELLDRLEAAEKEREALRAELAQLHKEADKFGDGIDWIQRSLQAEAQIEAMEKEEPSVPDGFAWPECPKRRQSHVLFDDGYEEGWAACVATIKAALAAPEPKP